MIGKLSALAAQIVNERNEIARMNSQTSNSSSTATVHLSQESPIMNGAERPTCTMAKKRHVDASSEDESASLYKYRKLTTEQKIIEFKTEDEDSDDSSYDLEDDDESSNDGQKHPKKEAVSPDSDDGRKNSCSCSSNDFHHENENNTTSSARHGIYLRETESESDTDSFGNSPQIALARFEALDKIRKPDEVMKKFTSVSTAYKISNHVNQTSQFSCNNDVEASDNQSNAGVSNRTIKQSNSDMCENIDTENVDKAEKMDSKNIAATDNVDEAEKMDLKNIAVTENVETENLDSENVAETENVDLENVSNVEKGNKDSENIADTQLMDSENIADTQLMDSENIADTQLMESENIADTRLMDSENIADTQLMDSENCEQTKSVGTENADKGSIKKDEKENFGTVEQIVETDVPSSSGNRISIPDDEQEAAIRNLLSNTQFAIISEPTKDNPSYVLKDNNSLPEGSEIVTEVTIPGNIEDYVEQPNSSNVRASEHSYQAPSISGAAEEQSFTDASRASSVSGLDLAHLVLSLKQDIQELSRKVDKQGTVLEAVVNANEIYLSPLFAETFQEKYKIQLPFTKIEDFDKFNKDLAKDKRFYNEFTTSLFTCIDNNVTLTKNILTMLRKYMSKDLVTLYTACKATGNKMVLKDTIFCKCLLQATKATIRNGLLPLEHEKQFYKCLGLVVSGAKGWNTHSDDEKKNNNSQG